MPFLKRDKSLAELEEINDRKGMELSIAEKESLIKQAKAQYGPGWREYFKGWSWGRIKTWLRNRRSSDEE